MATSRPLPDQRPGHELLTFVLNGVIVGLTALFVWSVVRLWRRIRFPIPLDAGWPGFRWRVGLGAVFNLAVALLVSYLALDAALWQMIAAFQPDFAGWVYAMAAALALKAAIELWMVLRRLHDPTARSRSRG